MKSPRDGPAADTVAAGRAHPYGVEPQTLTSISIGNQIGSKGDADCQRIDAVIKLLVH